MILSIICPTYNEERYIAQTLESFIKQKYHSFELEILICDGRSTDETRNIVLRYAEEFPIIKLVDNPDRKTPFAFTSNVRSHTETSVVTGLSSSFIMMPALL